MVYPAPTFVHTDVLLVPLHVLTSQEWRTRRHAPNTARHDLLLLPETTYYARGLPVFQHFSPNMEQKPNIKFNRNPFTSCGVM